MDPFLLAAVAFLSPILIAIFTKTSMSSRVKTTISIVVSALIGVAYVVTTSGLDFSQLAITVPAVFGVSQAAYRLLMQKVATSVEANYGLTDRTPGRHLTSTVPAVDGSEVVVATPILEETPAKG